MVINKNLQEKNPMCVNFGDFYVHSQWACIRNPLIRRKFPQLPDFAWKCYGGQEGQSLFNKNLIHRKAFLVRLPFWDIGERSST
jgi:hypothetical protein